MDLTKLCEKIHMGEDTTKELSALVPEVTPVMESAEAGLLFSRNTWEDGLAKVRNSLGDDPKGLKILTLMLLCCEKTWKIYKEHGISEEIFTDTMGCFSRFVAEHKESYGYEAFDRAFWTVRQISGVLFRIGTLEYELCPGEIQIHIPSDADLTKTVLRKSCDSARALIGRAFPDYKNAPMKCESWLLGPQLRDFLPEKSKILGFQSAFTITGTEDSDDVRQWVFKNPDLSNEDLPEDTSLQKKLKQFLLSGGIFRNGEGILKEPAFR